MKDSVASSGLDQLNTPRLSLTTGSLEPVFGLSFLGFRRNMASVKEEQLTVRGRKHNKRTAPAHVCVFFGWAVPLNWMTLKLDGVLLQLLAE